MSKEEASKKFAHAIFLMQDGSHRFAHSPAARGSNPVDLVLNKEGSTATKAYISAAKFDDAVQGVIYRALVPGRFKVAAQRASVSVAQQAADGDFDIVSVSVGALEPFQISINDMIGKEVLSDTDGAPVAWQPWTPRSAAALPAPAPAADPTITAREVRVAAPALVTLLDAMEVKPIGSKYSATGIARLLAAAG